MKTLCLCVFVFHLILKSDERLSGKRIRQQPNAQLLADFYGWVTRIRTGNDRTKTCSVTITPSPNHALCGGKGTKNLAFSQIFNNLSYFTVSRK